MKEAVAAKPGEDALSGAVAVGRAALKETIESGDRQGKELEKLVTVLRRIEVLDGTAPESIQLKMECLIHVNMFRKSLQLEFFEWVKGIESTMQVALVM